MILALLPLAGATGTVAPPTGDAQLWRLPVDATSTLWADDAGIAEGPSARVAASWMRDPVVWVWDDTGERESVVKDAVGLDVVAAWGFGPARLGVDLPVWPVASGTAGGGAGLGDLALDAKVRVWPVTAPVGLAVTGRLTLPTASDALIVGAKGVGWEAALVGDAEVGPVRLALNLGTRGAPEMTLPNVDLGARGLARLGAGYAVTDRAGVSLDVAGQLAFGDLGNAAGSPAEAILGGWVELGDALSVRGGVGKGLSRGIGAPTARAVLAVAWSPPAKDAAVSPVADKTAKPAQKPAKPEKPAVVEKPAKPASSPAVAQKPASSPAAPVVKKDNTARPDPTRPVRISKGGDLPPGLVHLRVRGPDGEAVAARWTLAGQDGGVLREGRGIAEVDPGSWRLVVEAAGYAPVVRQLEVESALTTALEITLRPALVTVAADRFVLTAPIRFVGAALASPEDPLLHELAAHLLAHPEILGVRVEGYVSRTRSLEQDLTMSGLRASAVKDWLVNHGVDADRLVVAGYGSGRPISAADPGNPVNDRVELVITARGERP